MDRRFWWIGAGGVLVLALGTGVAMLVLSDSGPGVRRAPASKEGEHRLATFNVGELFDPVDDPALSGDEDDLPTPEAHLSELARAIGAIDADVIALQGVESASALAWFRDTYLAELGYEHVAAIDVGHASGVENGVLSRYPLRGARVWPDMKLGATHPSGEGASVNNLAGKPVKFRRSPLLVTVELPHQGGGGVTALSLLVVELKGGDAYEYWREAEAEGVLQIAGALDEREPLVILGSFHAEPGDPSVDALLGAGYADVLGGRGESSRWVTEVGGDRTDLILANGSAEALLDASGGFVLGGSFSPEPSVGAHLPVAVGVRATWE